jgi:hypothetical protein
VVAQGVPGRLRPHFLDVRHYEGGRSSAVRTGRLYPRRSPWYSFLEAESAPGRMVPSVNTEKKSPVPPPGIDPDTVRLVAQCLNHYATPGPQLTTSSYIKIYYIVDKLLWLYSVRGKVYLLLPVSLYCGQ